MRKPLVIVDQDAEIKEMEKQLAHGREMFKEAAEFLKKQVDETYKKLVTIHWESIKTNLKERNLLPDDYSDENYTLEFKDGVLYLNDSNETNLLEMILSKLGDHS